MALTEFTKLANSELGYIYVNQDGTLVAENMMARQGWRALDQVVVVPDSPSYLKKKATSGYVKKVDGYKIILSNDSVEDASISGTAERYNILLPEDGHLNASIIRVHPVITDTSLKVLYKLGTPLYVPSGQTVEFSAHYTDPSGLSQVSGTNMQSPVDTTDYLANTLADGSGTNKTSDMVVTATYYGDTVYYSIANNATDGVYMTLLQARGYGIYYGNSIESTIDDAISQAAYGYAPFQFDMRYQKDMYLADMYGLSVIEEYKNPKSRITKMKYLANLNKNHMMSFLMLTIGALILGTEDRSGLSNHYYITDRAFTIKQGGIINVDYGVKQNDSYLSGGLNPITVEFNATDATDGLNFGYVPIASNISTRSYSAWVYYDGTTGQPQVIIGIFSDAAGFLVGPNSFYQKGVTGAGTWTFPVVPTGAWAHLVVTRDSSISTNAPTVYVDGVKQTVTNTGVQGGATASEVGSELQIGNVHTATINYGYVLNGKIFEPRIYNRILTPDDVHDLYNGGVPDVSLVTDGLVFQGLAVYSDNGDAAYLAGHTLLTTERVVENILRVAGIPHGAPVIRANP